MWLRGNCGINFFEIFLLKNLVEKKKNYNFALAIGKKA